jgi:glycosyltransferase involved in cell wall biosynthesis
MIDCCLQQTFKDWELIVVDDQSTDGTTQPIIEEYAKHDERIRFYVRDREPKGAQVCRNMGLEHSEGEYIIHFDADDLISETCFERRVKFIDEHPDIDFAVFPAKAFYDEKELVPYFTEKDHPHYDIWGLNNKGYQDALESFLKNDYAFGVWTNIFRRESIMKIKWDEEVKIYQDFDLIVRMLVLNYHYCYSGFDKPDYFYRKTPSMGAITSNFVTDEKCESTLRLFQKTLREVINLPDGKKRKKQFRRYIALHYKRMILQNASQAKREEYMYFVRLNYPLFYYTRISLVNCILNLIGRNRLSVKMLDMVMK